MRSLLCLTKLSLTRVLSFRKDIDRDSLSFQKIFANPSTYYFSLCYPESPRWLIKKGKSQEAREIMAILEGKDVDDPTLIADIQEMERVNEITSATKLTTKELLSNGKEMNLWRLSVACLAQAFQQLGGLNLVTYYATTVFEDSLGFDAELSRLMTGCLGTEFFLAALVALFVVDRLGRRQLMLWGAMGMGVSLLIIAACLSKATETYKAPAYAATVFIFIYNTCFAIGWLGVTWLYPAEVTPIRIRAEANGFSTCSNWIINYAVVQLAPIMINKIGWQTYLVFMCFNFMVSNKRHQQHDILEYRANPFYSTSRLSTGSSQRPMDTSSKLWMPSLSVRTSEARTQCGLSVRFVKARKVWTLKRTITMALLVTASQKVGFEVPRLRKKRSLRKVETRMCTLSSSICERDLCLCGDVTIA